MSDIFLLGGTSTVIQPDALDNFDDAASIENNVKHELQGRMIVDGSPVGERVFCRLHIVVIHDAGCSFYATPVVDGVLLTALRTYFSRPAPQSEERHDFMLPMGKVHTDFPNIRLGIVGEVGEAYIDLTDPTKRVHFEGAYYALEPLNTGRAKAASE